MRKRESHKTCIPGGLQHTTKLLILTLVAAPCPVVAWENSKIQQWPATYN